MRTVTIVLNSIVAVFFAGFLVYTFVAKSHLESLARRFVTEKTLHYAAPMVDIAEQALDSPLVAKVLNGDQVTALRHEIAEYRVDPAAYVSDLTREAVQRPRNPKPHPLLEKVAAIKERIRTFYDNTLAALIADLRIFAASNLVAAIIALGIVLHSPAKIRPAHVWFAFLMFVAVLYSSYMYVDDLTFFRILFRSHMGWWYPVLLCVVLVSLYLDYGRGPAAKSSPPQKNA